MNRARQGLRLDALVRILRDPDYRDLAVALFLLGISDGMITPYIPLWITQALHGTTWQASFVFVPFGLLTVVAGSATSAYSDRIGRRKGVILVSLMNSGSVSIGLAFAASYPLAVILFAAMAVEPFAVLFALLRDIILSKERDEQGGSGAFITTLIRTVYSLGWLVGPALGGWMVGVVSYRGLFLASALLLFSTSAWAWRRINDRRPEQPGAAATRGVPTLRETVLLGGLFFAGLLLFSGDTGRLTFLSLYLTEDLHLPVSDVSWTFSVAVVAELVFLPLAGRLADRFGVTPVLSAGILAQALFFFGMSRTRLYVGVLLLQVIYAFVIATSQGVAMLFAQRTLPPARTGLSTSTYLVSRGPAPLLNSLLVATSFIGPHLDRLFAVFGAFACCALVVVLALAGRKRIADCRARLRNEPGSGRE